MPNKGSVCNNAHVKHLGHALQGQHCNQAVSPGMLQRYEAGGEAFCLQQHHAGPRLLPMFGPACAVESGSHPVAFPRPPGPGRDSCICCRGAWRPTKPPACSS